MIKIKSLGILTPYITLPIQVQETIDGSLDLLYVEFKNVSYNSPLTIFGKIKAVIEDGESEKTLYMVVESDTVEEVIKNKLYNHKVMLIEETKSAERYFVDKSINQPIYSNNNGYVGEVKYRVYDRWKTIGGGYQEENISSEIIKNDRIEKYYFGQKLPSLKYFQPNPRPNTEIILKSQNSDDIIISDGIDKDFVLPDNLNHGEIYTIYYRSWNTRPTSDYREIIEYSYNIIYVGYPGIELTIKDTINILFITTETLRESDTPKFSIAELEEYNESDKYKKRVEEIYNSISPEFSFAKMSLVEALRMIGDKYGFEPRFRNDKLFLDLTDVKEKQELPNNYYSNIASQNSNQFCDKLDSFVSNLVNNIDVNEGAVKEPMAFAYKTIRTDYGQTHITTDNMLFATQFPIEKPIKLEIGYIKDINGTEYKVGDITDYLYEESEYNLLPSLEDIYPGSKKYALKYKRGEKNITGLYFKMEKPTSIQDFFEQYAIENIIKKKLGGGTLTGVANIFEIQYRLTYIPIIDARITQVREDISSVEQIVSLAYNQSATKVESQSFGGNLKANVNKLGNVERTKMYIVPRLSMLPKLSKVVDDDYVITTIKSEYYPKFIKCEVVLTKNYTKKNEYIGVNSNLDLFEYDRRNTIDRHIVYEDFCVISDSPHDAQTSLISKNGVEEFANSFKNKTIFKDKGVSISSAIATTIDINGNNLKTLAMPVISLGFGNSMAFMFEYFDTITGDSSAKTTDNGFREQYYNKYTNVFGSAEKLKLEFGTPSASPTSYASAVNIGNTLPQESAINILEPEMFFSTNDNNLIIKKDVGERLCFTYQIHFVSTDNRFIIGSALGSKNNLVSGSGNFEYKLYFLKNTIDKFQDKVSLEDAVEGEQLETLDNDNYFLIKLVIAPEGEFKSWAIVDVKDNKNDLILGKNTDIHGGHLVNMPGFYFKHKLEDY